MAMDKQEFVTMVQAWVLGKLFEICKPGGHYFSQMTDGNNSFDFRKFEDFAFRINHTVYAYCMNNKTLDGTCSDMECTLAQEAHRLFRSQITEVLDADIVRLRNGGDLDGAIRIYRKMNLVSFELAKDVVLAM